MRQLGQVQATKQGQTLHSAGDSQPCSLLPASPRTGWFLSG